MTDFEEPTELRRKIAKKIKETGYPLQMQVGRYFDGLGWNTEYCHYYLDLETGEYRELDVVARKVIKGILVHLLIECKHSASNHWVFFVPTLKRPAWRFPHMIKHLPIVGADGTRIVVNHLKVLPSLSRSKPFSLYMTIFGRAGGGKKRNGEASGEKYQLKGEAEFRSALLGAVKCTAYEIARWRDAKDRHLFLPIIVFDSGLFVVCGEDDTDPVIEDYVVYHHYQPFDVGSTTPGGIDPEFLREMRMMYMRQGASFIVEILKFTALQNWLEDLLNALDDFDQADLAGWGQPSKSVSEMLSGLWRTMDRGKPSQA